MDAEEIAGWIGRLGETIGKKNQPSATPGACLLELALLPGLWEIPLNGKSDSSRFVMPTTAMISPKESAAGSAIFNIARNIGGSIRIALVYHHHPPPAVS